MFFFAFHNVVVVVVVNIFSAFVIEAFVIEFENAKLKSASPLVKKIYSVRLSIS